MSSIFYSNSENSWRISLMAYRYFPSFVTPELWIERKTLALHPNALIIGLLGPTHWSIGPTLVCCPSRKGLCSSYLIDFFVCFFISCLMSPTPLDYYCTIIIEIVLKSSTLYKRRLHLEERVHILTFHPINLFQLCKRTLRWQIRTELRWQ